MEIKIIRFGRYHHAVSGRLLIDGQHVCDTLEQDTGSLPEGEYVMCRNKASALPYYIYSGKEDIGSGLEQKADCAKEQKSDCVPEEKNRKVFLSMGNGIHGWRRRCIIVGECLHLGFLIRSQEHYDQLLPRLRMQLVRHRPIVVKISRSPDFVDAA
ncbi:DUF5675 family protein [Segatella copri]|jgi:hypothetical protein|uniref:DUF5675 family protein n=1 Tax=Segatella copri TaxID=165179 RepID=UPI001C48371D|nr:DUF5675 family protein [Segatella copri]WOZ83236.1 DUF5675 family protein [Segatella copri]